MKDIPIMGAVRFAMVLGAALLVAPTPAGAQDDESRRTDRGIRMFGTFIAADADLPKKTDNGKLLLAIFYTSDAERAAKLAADLRLTPGGEPRVIAGLPVEVVTTRDAGLAAFANRQLAGVFLAQPPDSRTLRTLVEYGISRRVIVYSPFDGHVESGVHAGQSIGAQVKPYVNRNTLAASQITLKEIFMKVTKVYP